MTTNKRGGGYRSLFWPIILISVGVIWLLGNAGLLGCLNLMVLFRLWPVILIAIGLDLLIGRNSALVGTLIGLGTVALLIVLMLAGPSLGLVNSPEVQQASLVEPLDNAESAAVALNLSVGEVTISALTNDSDLMTADLNYAGDLDFRTEGEQNRQITLGVTNEGGNINWEPFSSMFPCSADLELRWDIALSPNVPLTLDINGGVGTATFDLAGLELDRLALNGGVGETELNLPAGTYEARIGGGVGEVTVAIASGADITLDINGGVGQVTVDVPDDASVRLEANGGLGDIGVPRGFTQISERNDQEVWESSSYRSDAESILILYNGGVGGLTIR